MSIWSNTVLSLNQVHVHDKIVLYHDPYDNGVKHPIQTKSRTFFFNFFSLALPHCVRVRFPYILKETTAYVTFSSSYNWMSDFRTSDQP